MYEQYSCLVQMGGRPSAQIQTDPGPWDPSGADEHLHVAAHWQWQWHQTYNELERWKAFRKYQESKRRSVEVFAKYKATLHTHQVQKDIPWSLTIELDMERQSKVDTWKEYYLYEHRKLEGLEKRFQYLDQLPKNMKAEGEPTRGLWRVENALEKLNHLLGWILGELTSIIAETREEKENIHWVTGLISSPRPGSPRHMMSAWTVPSQTAVRGSFRKNTCRITRRSPASSNITKVLKPTRRKQPARVPTRSMIDLHQAPSNNLTSAESPAPKQFKSKAVTEKVHRSDQRKRGSKHPILDHTNPCKVKKQGIAKPKTHRSAFLSTKGSKESSPRRSARIRERMERALNRHTN